MMNYKFKSFTKSQFLWILLFTVVVSYVIFTKTYYNVPTGDERVYEYIWENDDSTSLYEPGHRFERKISNLSEILQTQIIHYQKVNGRFIAHFIEQAFTGHTLLFSIINTLVFITFVCSIVYCITNKFTYNFSLWLLIICALVYFFPSGFAMWTSVNLSPNYLWPACMSVAILIISDKIDHGSLLKIYNLPTALFALIFGWTSEAFVVGIAGGLLCYYCFNKSKFKQQILWLIIPMFITGAFLIFSPGNFNRYAAESDNKWGGVLKFLYSGTMNLTDLWMFRLMIIGVLISLIIGQKQNLKLFIKKNAKLVYVYIVAFIFSMMANTLLRTHTLMELMSLILMLKYLYNNTNIFKSKLTLVIACILSVLISTHQLILAKDIITDFQYKSIKLEEWRTSSDGLILYKRPAISCTSKNYISDWSIDPTHRAYSITLYDPMVESKKKPIIILNPIDYRAIGCPNDSFFIPQNKIPGIADIYTMDGARFLWLKPNTLTKGQKLQAELKPVSFNDNVPLRFKIKYGFNSKAYTNTVILQIDTLQTRFGTSYRITKPSGRIIKKINIVD